MEPTPITSAVTESPLTGRPGVNFVYAHTSGHAPVADLQRLAAALNPRKLVPIHTEHGEDFSQLFANVVTLNDGEVFVLA